MDVWDARDYYYVWDARDEQFIYLTSIYACITETTGSQGVKTNLDKSVQRHFLCKTGIFGSLQMFLT